MRLPSYRQKLSASKNESSSPSKVLFVDKDSLLLGLIEKELEQVEELEFFGEENAKVGLSKAKNIQPDIIVLDHVAKGLSGEQFLNKIQRIGSLENTKILMLSKKIDSKRIQRYDELGVDDFIQKPFKIAELIFRLKKLK